MSSGRSYSLSELVEATGFDRRTIVYYIQSGLLPKVGRRGPHTRYPSECLTRLHFIRGVRRLQTDGLLLTATLSEIRRALLARDTAAISDLLDRGLPGDELTALFAENSGPEPERPAPIEPPPPLAPPPLAQPGLTQPPTMSIAPESVRPPAGDRRSYGLADAGIRKRFGVEKPPATASELRHDETHPGMPAHDPATFQPSSSTAPVTTGAETAAVEPELGELLRELEVRPTLNARRSPPGAPEQWTEIPITSRVYLSIRGLGEDDVPLAEAVARLLKRALRSRPGPTP